MISSSRLRTAIMWRWRGTVDSSSRLLRPRRLLTSALYRLNFYRIAHYPFPRLNLGGGDTKIDGFWNIDANPFSKSDVIGGIDHIRLASESVELIYCSHVLEHMPRAACGSVLKEWYRLLKPGGRILVGMPDMEALCKLYLENLSRSGPLDKLNLITGIFYGGQSNRFNFHFNGHSFLTLKTLLEDVGFVDVRRFDGQSIDFCLPAGDGTSAQVDGVPVSLNISARKALS